MPALPQAPAPGLVAILLCILPLPSPATAAAAPRTFQDCPQCPSMVVVPAGSFIMGTPRAIQVPTEVPAELDPRRVTIGHAFALGRYEVTRAQYAQFARDTGRDGRLVRCRTWVESRRGFRDLDTTWDRPRLPANPRSDHPATCVDWHDAHDYAAWLSQRTGQRYRLPSEAEWEYAARAGSTTLLPWGRSSAGGCSYANSHDLTSRERYPLAWAVVDCRDGFADVAPVGSLRPNAFGLYDMIGNVWEWLEDCASLSYAGRPTDQRPWTWDGGCKRRIQRGGGWSTGPERSRPGFHGDGDDEDRADFAGFRVARDLEPGGTTSDAAIADTGAERGPTAAAMAGASVLVPAARGPLQDCAECPELVVVPAGQLQLGTSADAYEHDLASGETPALAVTIRRPFALGRFEVTHEQFARFRAVTGLHESPTCAAAARAAATVAATTAASRATDAGAAPDAAAICVDRDSAERFLAWLSARSGRRYRLPSEAEWEYAARAGSGGARPWSARDSHEGVSISRACDHANVYDVDARGLRLPVPHARCADGYVGVAPVGSFLPNAWGLYDMIGNARERVADCYTRSYKGRPADERAWRWSGCTLQAVRGGSWRSRPFAARSAARDALADDAPDIALLDVGLRVARDLEPAELGAVPSPAGTRP